MVFYFVGPGRNDTTNLFGCMSRDIIKNIRHFLKNRRVVCGVVLNEEGMIWVRRVGKILNDPFYIQCLERNAALEVNRRFCRHDLQHMLDVSRIAYILMLEKGDDATLVGLGDNVADPVMAKEMVYAAGLLHDMGRWQEYETGEDHALVGARLAVSVLERAGFDAAQREIVVAAIREHRVGGKEGGLLGQYISRADDLSRPCSYCLSRSDCYKLNRMETADLLLY